MFLSPVLIPLIKYLGFRIFPPRKYTIISKKTGKAVSFNMRGENDPKEMVEFGKVFFGQE